MAGGGGQAGGRGALYGRLHAWRCPAPARQASSPQTPAAPPCLVAVPEVARRAAALAPHNGGQAHPAALPLKYPPVGGALGLVPAVLPGADGKADLRAGVAGHGWWEQPGRGTAGRRPRSAPLACSLTLPGRCAGWGKAGGAPPRAESNHDAHAKLHMQN